MQNGCSEAVSKYIEHIDDGNHKITYCSKMDRDAIKLIAPIDVNSHYIGFDYIGYPQNKNISFYFENQSGKKHPITDLQNSAGKWFHTIVQYPQDLNGQISLVAEDNATQSYGWVGLGGVYALQDKEVEKYSIYGQTLLYITLFSLFVSGIFSLFLKKYDQLKAFITTSLALGLLSLFAFNLYYFLLDYAYLFSWFLFGVALYGWIRIEKRNFRTVLLLFVSLFAMIGTIMFIAYSDIDIISSFQELSANRWHLLPVDNWIPKIFANGILNGDVRHPLVGSWLSSDRPPLQTGFYLIFSIVSYDDLLYLVVSIGAQLLVIVLVFFFLLEFFQDKIYVFIASILLFFNGFVFVHSLFVWPKLLSALFQAIAFYYTYRILQNKGKNTREYILFGVAFALAFLSHGGSAFYLLSLGLILLFSARTQRNILHLLYATISAFLIYLPWILYQKLIDPPGDRLLKWHLAGMHQPTKESFTTLLMQYYENISFSQWIQIQFNHLYDIYYSFYYKLPTIFSFPHNKFLDSAFFYTNFSYLFFTIFFAVLYFFVYSKMGKEKDIIKLFLLSFILYTVVWSLLITGGTVIHQGSYFGWFSGFLAVSYIVYKLSKTLFFLFAIGNLFFFAKVYVYPYIFHKEFVSSLMFLIFSFLYIYINFQKIKGRRDENTVSTYTYKTFTTS